MFHIFGALAEFERSLTKERTHAGLKAARAQGRNGGCPEELTDHQLKMAKVILGAPNTTVTQVAEHFEVARSTLYQTLKGGGIDV